jgi:predicted nucleic acid-binding protein
MARTAETLVVDASAALNVAATALGFRILDAFVLVAPPLMWSEATSCLYESVYRKDISVAMASAIRDRLGSAPVYSRRPDNLHAEAWAVANQLGWAKTYDAEYVALSRLLGCRLLTIDERLVKGAGRVAKVISPSEIRS